MEEVKKLERSMGDRVLGGVCSGLGHYLDIDPTIVRLAFCIAFFVFGTGILVYFILWLAMPANEGPRQTSATNDSGETMPQTTPNNPKGNTAVGIILIVLGGWLLACNYLPELSLRKLWPVAIIAIGIIMIVNALKKKES